MKTKLCLLVAILLGTTQPSLAPIGYATVAFSNGYNLVSNPLSAGLTNGANEIMTPIEGEIILTYNGATFESTAYDSTLGGWVDANSRPSAPPSLPPGRGFFLFNPGPKTNITFTGQI